MIAITSRFDFTGNDVNREWKKLSETNPGKDQAMLEFIRLLDVICPAFRDHVNEQKNLEANKLSRVASLDDTSTSKSEVITRLQTIANGSETASKEALQKFEQQKKLIQEALNKQTYHQFLAYAQQTHPGEQDKQEKLIKQLQEQHFEQYMSQVYARQAQAQAASLEAVSRGSNCDGGESTPGSTITTESQSSNSNASHQGPTSALNNGKSKVRSVNEHGNERDDSEVSDEDGGGEEPANPSISPASLWTLKNIKEFKANIQKEGPDGVLKIGHGETITVRVPTHPEGNSLYWEFATDYYDVGFGVYFEWTVAESNAVTVHVEESGDEYDEGLEAAEIAQTKAADDLESGSQSGSKKYEQSKPQTDEIIPIFRNWGISTEVRQFLFIVAFENLVLPGVLLKVIKLMVTNIETKENVMNLFN